MRVRAEVLFLGVFLLFLKLSQPFCGKWMLTFNPIFPFAFFLIESFDCGIRKLSKAICADCAFAIDLPNTKLQLMLNFK